MGEPGLAESRARLSAELATSLADPQDPARMAAYVLRTKNTIALDAMARAATAGSLGSDELAAHARDDSVPVPRDGLSYAWLRHLARATALLCPDGSQTAVNLFEAAARAGLSEFEPENAEVFAQVLIREGLLRRLDDALPELPVSADVDWAVRSDRAHPIVGGTDNLERWLSVFNEVFTAGDLEPVGLTGEGTTFFARLHSEAPVAQTPGGLVTVVMPAYRPDPTIFTAVRSVLAQTWQNLELLVVDDASPVEFGERFRQIAALDERVRIIRLPANRGTYAARNRGLAEARGTYVTFQDADDWSHPRRIERQVAPLLASPDLLATRSRSLRAYPDLTLTFPGYPPVRVNASSLLFRREPVLSRLGRFDSVRKSADVEFPQRLRAVVGPDCLIDLDSAPLAVVQLLHGSLSRADATPGWIAWSRIAYRNSYQQWHKEIRAGQDSPFLGPGTPRPFPLPEASWSAERQVQPVPEFDVVVVNDWRGRRKETWRHLNQVLLMKEAGLRVAIAHAETPLPVVNRRASLAPAVQRALNRSAVPLVHLSQEVRARHLIIAHPDVAQFLPPSSALRADTVTIQVISAEPQRPTGTPVQLADCDAMARQTFDRTPRWLARDAAARARLAQELPAAPAVDANLPLAVAPPTLATPRRTPGGRLVIGTQPVELAVEQARDAGELLTVFPDDDAVDVRFRGDLVSVQEFRGRRRLPPNWLVYAPAEASAREYLAQLDAFVYPFAAPPLAVRQAAVEAMAAGCVVVLHPEAQSEFGRAARYATAAECMAAVSRLCADPDRMADQQARGRAYAREQYEAFRAELSSVVGQPQGVPAGHAPS